MSVVRISGDNQRESQNMQHSLSNMYKYLQGIHMEQHARDFWSMRALKQHSQLETDPLSHEHTAISQYLQWHDQQGIRLAKCKRYTQENCNTNTSLMSIYKSKDLERL